MRAQAANTSPPSHPRPIPSGETAGSGRTAMPAAQRHAHARHTQQREQFESALRRQSCREENAPDDKRLADAGPVAAPSTPVLAALSPPQALRDPAMAAQPTAGATPRTAPAQDAVSTHLRALGAAPLGAVNAHWQVQWADAAAPVQQVDLRRIDNGQLQAGWPHDLQLQLRLNPSGSSLASEPARLARLRDRVAARAAVGEVLVFAQAAADASVAGGAGRSRSGPGSSTDDTATP
jgi:hypothetical protein